MLIPYKEQIDAVNIAAIQGRGGIVMPTGTGKSITMALLIAKMQVKTLVVCPTLDLKNQLSETFAGLFGSLDNIVVENIDSPRLKKIGAGFGMLIIDECHGAASATYQKLNRAQWGDIYHRFFFTATFFRNVDAEHLLFKSICGDEIYRLTYDMAVRNKLIVPVEGYYYSVPKQPVDGHTYAQVYKQLVVENPVRNAIISDLMLNLQGAGVAQLCLVKEIAHGNILSEMTGIPFANGQDESSRHWLEAFKTGEILSLIATTGLAGQGSDTKPCEYVIIAGLGKAKSSFMQAVGRSVRVYPGKESGKVILFKDTSNKYCLRHFNAQSAILQEEYGVISQKLEV